MRKLREKVRVKTGVRGLVLVNEHFQTNIEHIYAASDAIGFPALASTSMEQARRAALHALNLPGRTISPLLPAGIYTIPEVSMVGETEESLRKKDTAYIVGGANYRQNAPGPDHRRSGGLSQAALSSRRFKIDRSCMSWANSQRR